MYGNVFFDFLIPTSSLRLTAYYICQIKMFLYIRILIKIASKLV